MKFLATLCVLALGGAAITAVGSSFDAPKLTVAVNVKITAHANTKYYVVIVFVDNVQSLPMLKAAPFTTNGQGVVEFQAKEIDLVGMKKNTAYIFKAYLFPTSDDADSGTNRIPSNAVNHTTANGPVILPAAPLGNDPE